MKTRHQARNRLMKDQQAILEIPEVQNQTLQPRGMGAGQVNTLHCIWARNLKDQIVRVDIRLVMLSPVLEAYGSGCLCITVEVLRYGLLWSRRGYDDQSA